MWATTILLLMAMTTATQSDEKYSHCDYSHATIYHKDDPPRGPIFESDPAVWNEGPIDGYFGCVTNNTRKGRADFTVSYPCDPAVTRKQLSLEKHGDSFHMQGGWHLPTGLFNGPRILERLQNLH